MQERLRIVRAKQAAAVADNEGTVYIRPGVGMGEDKVQTVSASGRVVVIQSRRLEIQETQCGEGAWARTWLGGEVT